MCPSVVKKIVTLVKQTSRRVERRSMKDEYIGIRVPSALKSALAQEQKRMSRKAGAEVKTSAVIRAILEERLLRQPRSRSATKAA